VNAIAPGALNTRLLYEVLSEEPGRVGADFYQLALKQKTEGSVFGKCGTALHVSAFRGERWD
jgi:3-oxoacyl-[acyl-carrier protein] reductase